MKKYYVEEIAEVVVQHIVFAKSKKNAIEQLKQGEVESSEIIEFLGCGPMDITEVGLLE